MHSDEDIVEALEVVDFPESTVWKFIIYKETAKEGGSNFSADEKNVLPVYLVLGKAISIMAVATD